MIYTVESLLHIVLDNGRFSCVFINIEFIDNSNYHELTGKPEVLGAYACTGLRFFCFCLQSSLNGVFDNHEQQMSQENQP